MNTDNNNNNNHPPPTTGSGTTPSQQDQSTTGTLGASTFDQGQDLVLLRDYLHPDQRRTIDWSDYAAHERFHSQNYNPHQGVAAAVNWGQHPMMPRAQDTTPTRTQSSSVSSETGLNTDPGYSSNVRSVGPLQQNTTHVTSRTSILNPIPQNALEPFHRRDLEHWGTNVLAFNHALHTHENRSRFLASSLMRLRNIESRLCESVNRFQHHMEQYHSLECVLATLRESSLNVIDIFIQLAEAGITSAEDPRGGENAEGDTAAEMELRLLRWNNETVQHVLTMQQDTVRLANSERQRIQVWRNSLGLTNALPVFLTIFERYAQTQQQQQEQEQEQQQGQHPEIFALLKAQGRADQIYEQHHRAELTALGIQAQSRLRLVKADEKELDRRMYLFYMALDLALPKNGAQVKRLLSIRSPIALQMFNTPSVCQVERLEIDFEKMDWDDEDWRMLHEEGVNAMSRTLFRLLEAQQRSSAETVSAQKFLDIGYNILARNLGALEKLNWKGPACQDCHYTVMQHICDIRKPYALDLDAIFKDVPTQGQERQEGQQPQGSTSHNWSYQELPPVSLPTQSRLVILNLQFWKFTRSCLNRVIEFSPHLLSLELRDCTLLRDISTSHTSDGRNNKYDRLQEPTSVFQHRGLRVLAISMTTLFTEERQQEFYEIFHPPAPPSAPAPATRNPSRNNRCASDYEDDQDNDDDRSSSYSSSDEGAPYEASHRSSSSSSNSVTSYSRFTPYPDYTTPEQFEAIDKLEPSLFQHFPNLEHWKITPGTENLRMMFWIGSEIRRYCPNLNKLTIAPSTFEESESPALFLRIFRPIPTDPEEFTAADLRGIAQNVMGKDKWEQGYLFGGLGYMLAHGKGLKMFRAEEGLYGRSVAKSLLLHTSTLEVLDLDLTNKFWNLWPGHADGVQHDGTHDVELGRGGQGEDEDDEQSNGATVMPTANTSGILLPPPQLLPHAISPIHASQFALVNGQGIGLGYGNQLPQDRANASPQSLPTISASNPGQLPAPRHSLSPLPLSEPSMDGDDDGDGYEGPWRVRRVSADLDRFFQQCHHLRQIKLPRNAIDISQHHSATVWNCASTLEELWVSIHGLSCSIEIAQIMKDINAVPVQKFKHMHDRYDNPEGVVPLPPKDLWNNGNNIDINGAKLESRSQLQEYFNRVIFHEGESGHYSGIDGNDGEDDEGDDASDNESEGAAGTQPREPARPPASGSRRYKIICLLRQLPRLRYIWIGDGLYQLPPRMPAESLKDLAYEGSQGQGSKATLIEPQFPHCRCSDDISENYTGITREFEWPLMGHPSHKSGISVLTSTLSPTFDKRTGNSSNLGNVLKQFRAQGLKRGRSGSEAFEFPNERNVKAKHM
ncbi:hypothetical protein BGX27_005870 [Mortierella sp. AM989]|nr:hypothetical protein BGX27_005870 [Mortierella sp. AM989]